jgi:hypothetical protein
MAVTALAVAAAVHQLLLETPYIEVGGKVVNTLFILLVAWLMAPARVAVVAVLEPLLRFMVTAVTAVGTVVAVALLLELLGWVRLQAQVAPELFLLLTL